MSLCIYIFLIVEKQFVSFGQSAVILFLVSIFCFVVVYMHIVFLFLEMIYFLVRVCLFEGVVFVETNVVVFVETLNVFFN